MVCGGGGLQLVLYGLRRELVADDDARIHQQLERVVDRRPADVEVLLLESQMHHLHVEVAANTADVFEDFEALCRLAHSTVGEEAGERLFDRLKSLGIVRSVHSVVGEGSYELQATSGE